ncbi:fimbrial protein [Porphyromonas pogonae]|uniref:fimbrial tip adhesin FimD n=1 Tax=Porphyromonas pogonae TaxID=867595 RepID=UPI002E77D4FC|nr:fimbrial protein [Porphyromonas pogonae]
MEPFEAPIGAKSIEINITIGGTIGHHSAGSGSLRATEPGNKYSSLNEDKIENIDVFFFNTDGTLNWHVEPQFLKKTGESRSAVITAIVSRDKISQIEGKSLRLVIVANHTISIPQSIDYNGLKSLVQESVELNTPDIAQMKFLMDGEVDTSTITWGDSYKYTIPNNIMLRRAAAKVRLRVKNFNVKSRQNGVEVTYNIVGDPEVKLVHYASKTSLLQTALYNMQSSDWKTDAYRPMKMIAFHDKINDTDKNSTTNLFYSTSVPFYAYENDWTNNPESETYLLLKINLSSGGLSPKPYYYRIPINYRFPMPDMSKEEQAGLYRLQRNYLYDIVCTVNILGGEDEEEPIDLSASIAVQPWIDVNIDGNIKSAHYLVVKELFPIMPNQNYREIEYLSNLPVEIKIDRTEYEYYDEYGRLIKYIDDGQKMIIYVDGVYNSQHSTNNFGGTKITNDESILSRKILKIEHSVPTNYVPFNIYFTVKHVMPTGEEALALSQQVHVTQYPPKYVTGTKSEGFKGGTSSVSGADFRFHDILGVIAPNPVTGEYKPQTNDVFYKITTVVNVGNEKIGDPTNSDGSTKSDLIANKIISPQFIVATQHGMSSAVYQYSGGYKRWGNSEFGAGYGPYSDRFSDVTPYYDPSEYNYNYSNQYQPNYTSYTYAADRCASYFEGEYGMDGVYEEYLETLVYNNGTGNYEIQRGYRKVNKTFKYKGRWRLPTTAELEYIESIQASPTSAVKNLLWGAFYWSAETGVAYKFSNKYLGTAAQKQSGLTNTALDNGTLGYYPNTSILMKPYVRCVFDTYKHQ